MLHPHSLGKSTHAARQALQIPGTLSPAQCASLTAAQIRDETSRRPARRSRMSPSTLSHLRSHGARPRHHSGPPRAASAAGAALRGSGVPGTLACMIVLTATAARLRRNRVTTGQLPATTRSRRRARSDRMATCRGTVSATECASFVVIMPSSASFMLLKKKQHILQLLRGPWPR